MSSLGIIGTAFRGKDTNYDSILTKELYFKKILPKTLEVIEELDITTVISGGAAGIDHLAPLLVNYGYLYDLEIYYPTKFTDTESLIAKTLIKYHLNFSSICWNNPYHTLASLGYLYNKQTPLEVNVVFTEEPVSTKYEGFFSRNEKIANNSDYLLVFSYFDEDGNCLTNGTKNTITKFLAKNTEDTVIKVDIRDLI